MKQFIFALCILMTATPAMALTPEERGLQIAVETDQRDSGFRDYVVDGEMILEDGAGNSARRVFTMNTFEVEDDGDKRVVVFSDPPDLSGMVSLTHSHGLEPDDQWLYLPALRRTKRLAARDKTGSFAGSEFAFEDISTFEVKKYTYRYLRDEVQDNRDCFVLEDIPAYPYSGYSRIVEWVDKEIYQPRLLVYFDRTGRELKELRLSDYRQFEGRYWRPMKSVMRDLRTGAVSTINWSDYRFGTGLDDGDFRSTALRRLSR